MMGLEPRQGRVAGLTGRLHVRRFEVDPDGVISHHIGQFRQREDSGVFQPGGQLVVVIESC